MTHGTEETRLTNFKTLQEMRIISECQGKAFRYPVIKSWFLEKYPEIAHFGMTGTQVVIEEAKASIVNPAQEQAA